MAALPRLTELTVLYPHPRSTTTTVTENPLDVVEAIRSVTLELVDACKALPDFDTLQVVHSVTGTPPSSILDLWSVGRELPSAERQNEVSKEQANGVKDWAMGRLRKLNAGCREGERRRRTTLRVIELSTYGPLAGSHLDSLTVEEREVVVRIHNV